MQLKRRPDRAGGRRSFLCAAGLFLVNVYICRELFRTEYLNQMGSIEAAFIGLARYVKQDFTDLTWFPLWYGGVPYQDSYPPLLHWIVAITAATFRWSPALSYHFVTACFYCLAPVSLFFLCLEFSGSRLYSFFAGLVYSVLSPSILLVAQIRQELGWMRPRRLQALVAWGEGPHIAALAVLPFAVLSLHRAATRRRPVDFVLCALLFAATVSLNWLGAVALFVAGIAYICATGFRNAIVAAPISLLAYGMIAPWIPPSTIGTIRLNAPYLGPYSHVYAEMPRNLALLALSATTLIVVLRFLPASLPVRFSGIFGFLMAALVLPMYWWKIYILPQPERYQLEMELGLAMLIVFSLKPLIDRVPKPGRVGIAIALLLLAIIPARSDRRFARYLLAPIDITRTIEYKTAMWLNRNLSGQRVFASGSTQFWLNAFGETSEVSGGFDNGVVNQVVRTASYIIRTGDGAGDRDAEISLLWLKAMGVHAVIVQGADSTEAYHDDRNPKKFEGVLPALWHEDGDTIYAVPQRSASLARVMARSDLVLRTPANGIDIQALRTYVSALEDPTLPESESHWITRHSLVVHASLTPEQLVSLQISYHSGWHATVNGVDHPLAEDGLGLMYIEPNCNGDCRIELGYDGGREMRIARWAAMTSWIFVVFLLFGRTVAVKVRRAAMRIHQGRR